MHPGGPVAGRKAKNGVGDKKVMFCASLEETTTAVIATYAVLPDNAIPGDVILALSCIKVTKNDELLCYRN